MAATFSLYNGSCMKRDKKAVFRPLYEEMDNTDNSMNNVHIV